MTIRKSMKDELKKSLQDFIDIGLPVTFTTRQLQSLGLEVQDIDMNSHQIQHIRKMTRLSQGVFAKVLNVSVSAVRQWEQGKRSPSGSAKVLLELLEKDPHVLDYRLQKS